MIYTTKNVTDYEGRHKSESLKYRLRQEIKMAEEIKF